MASKQRRVAFVTGSTSGIGLGIANRFASTGYDVIITGFAPQDVIDEALNDLKSKYPNVKVNYVGADFRKEDEIARMCDDIMKLYPNGIDILINNAGFQHVAPIDEYPINVWHDMVAIHLTASFLLVRFFLPYMKKKGWGRIVNMASVMGLISTKGKAPYSSMKSALIGMARGVALEVAEHGITCNAICPGYVETDLVKKQIQKLADDKGLTYEQMRDEFFSERHPTKKPISVEQVASLVGFLCSDEAASITGSAQSIDAGYTAR